VGGVPIDKCRLLEIIAKQYEKRIEIEPDDTVVVDRTLNSSHFKVATGYVAAGWLQLIQKMYEDGVKGR
jgi:dTDP-4-dehydrorhamnose reductase